MANPLSTQKVTDRSNIYLAIAVISILALMILPIPPFIMDVFLVMSITGGLVILFVALYIHNPLDFSVFPSVLLIITLFRLSLNVSTTRLILSRGYAGEIINTFGGFVIGGNYVVGVVIFLILVIINFVVITKGAGRIAEVSARFTLDAMPGKQMAIDADLNAGLIDDREAQRRRNLIAQEAEFYGAMDGAAKFVRGDAIAGLLITSINIIGGLAIGVFQNGMGFGEAANQYTIMTVGDGLVAQIPALIVSTSAGIIITRATGEASMGNEITRQLAKQPKAAFVSAGVLFLLGIVPGLPFFPFTIMAAIISIIAFGAQKKQEQLLEEEQQEEKEEIEEAEEENIEDYLHPDPFEIEIGYGLIPLVDKDSGGNLLGRISTIRKSIAMELGIVIPSIRIRDNIQLKSNQYLFKIYGIEKSNGEVLLDHFLVLNPDDRVELEGHETVEPTFGLPAIWIPKKEKEKAEVAGYTVIEPPAIIATHLMEVLKNNAHKLLDRQKTQQMLDHLKETHPAVVEGVIPDMVSLGTLTQILKNLLKEKIPIRNMVKIIETIADYAAYSKEAEVLTEYVRKALSETITDYLKQDNKKLPVITFDPRLEDHIMSAVQDGNGQTQNLGLNPNQVQEIFNTLNQKKEEIVMEGSSPILLVSPPIRKAVRNFTEPVLPDLNVVAYSELTPDTEIKSLGTIGDPHEN
ncbi:MAG: flagellar biosynthesis protein FlhA [Candidatus Marinimicrobia bacterium]|nr:flagellar biosynthesis protein FlhA [Candidatus Neomarinimicrobiota bacterium]